MVSGEVNQYRLFIYMIPILTALEDSLACGIQIVASHLCFSFFIDNPFTWQPFCWWNSNEHINLP